MSRLPGTPSQQFLQARGEDARELREVKGSMMQGLLAMIRLEGEKLRVTVERLEREKEEVQGSVEEVQGSV